MSLVSVIIPTYNGEAFIENAIASILKQNYPNYEIIIVDDGSKDNTRNIISNYAVTPIFQENKGVAEARNKGLEVARGDYIAFLDQDDFFLPHKLEQQVAVMEETPQIGIVNSGWQIVDTTGVYQAAVQPWLNLPQLNPTELIIWKPVFLGAMLFRHYWLKKTAGFRADLEQTPDVELVLQLAALGCTGDWVKETTVAYRQHESNASKNTPLQAEELDRMLEQFFAQSGIKPEIKALESQSRYQSLVWSAWRLYDTEYLKEMSHHLLKSQQFCNTYTTEMIFDWINSFKKYAQEYGKTIDVKSLTNSPEWQDLIAKVFVVGNGIRSVK